MKQIISVLVLALCACGATEKEIEGEAGGPCLTNGKCNDTLVCAKDTCVADDDPILRTLNPDGTPIVTNGSLTDTTAWLPVRFDLTQYIAEVRNHQSCTPSDPTSCDTATLDIANDRPAAVVCDSKSYDYRCEVGCVQTEQSIQNSCVGEPCGYCLPETDAEQSITVDIIKDVEAQIGTGPLQTVTPTSITIRVTENAWEIDKLEVWIGDRLLAVTEPIARAEIPVIVITEWDTNKARDDLGAALRAYDTPFDLKVLAYMTFHHDSPTSGIFKADVNVSYSATW